MRTGLGCFFAGVAALLIALGGVMATFGWYYDDRTRQLIALGGALIFLAVAAVVLTRLFYSRDKA